MPAGALAALITAIASGVVAVLTAWSHLQLRNRVQQSNTAGQQSNTPPTSHA